MKKLPEVKINTFQLAVLLDDLEKDFYRFMIDNLIYCPRCRGYAIEGVDVENLCLTDLNDVRIVGRCRKCRGEVARLFEFGNKKGFYKRACRFRESIMQ